MSDKQNEATSLIVEQLVESGIKLVASLPDDWIAPLIHAVDKDDRFKHVPVNREESAIGLCLTKLLDSISLPFLLVEERKTIARIPAAFKHCHAMNRPEVVIFSEA